MAKAKKTEIEKIIETDLKPKSEKKKSLERILEYHEKKVNDAKQILMNNEDVACYDNIVNTSGNILILPDFHALSINPSSQETFQMEPGERLNLLTMFDIKDVNRNRKGLLTASKMKGIYGLPAITFVEDLDVVFPFELRKETLYEKGVKMKEENGGGDTKINLPRNEFDIKLQEEKDKEKKYNDRLEKTLSMSGGDTRKTKDEIELEELAKL